MKNYNKIRGILRAKNGSQNPKYQSSTLDGGMPFQQNFGMMNDANIDYAMMNSFDPREYLKDQFRANISQPYYQQPSLLASNLTPNLGITNTPISSQTQSDVDYIKNNLAFKGNKDTLKPGDQWTRQDTYNVSQQTSLNAMQSPTFANQLKQVNPNTPSNLNTIPDSAKINPSFGQKAGAVFKGLGSKAKTFAQNNQGMVTDVINGATDSLLGGTENSSEFNVLNKGLGWASKIKGPVGWYATAARVGLNAINKIGARKIVGHTMSTHLKSKAGNYQGLLALNSQVEADKNKSFGTFNAGGFSAAKDRQNKLIAQMGTAEQILGTAEDQQALTGNELNYLGYQMQQDGGVPTQFLRSAKQGGTLTQRINLVKSRKFKEIINVDTKQIEEFKEGGKLDWEPVIELIDWEPEIELEVLKEGGIIKEDLETPEIEETSQKNLIPEGALHKNKHRMEHTEGLTQKGIPVIDNEGEQQAEIEKEEIVFTLEVTKFLEEHYHKYYSDKLPQKEKDQLAIEAGKELVYQILENTDDKAGLIAKCEEGGKLCQ